MDRRSSDFGNWLVRPPRNFPKSYDSGCLPHAHLLLLTTTTACTVLRPRALSPPLGLQCASILFPPRYEFSPALPRTFALGLVFFSSFWLYPRLIVYFFSSSPYAFDTAMNSFSLNDLCLRMHRVRPFRYRGPLFTRESIQSSEGLSASLRVRYGASSPLFLHSQVFSGNGPLKGTRPTIVLQRTLPFYAQRTPHRRGAPIVDKAQVARGDEEPLRAWINWVFAQRPVWLHLPSRKAPAHRFCSLHDRSHSSRQCGPSFNTTMESFHYPVTIRSEDSVIRRAHEGVFSRKGTGLLLGDATGS
ncbi:hypothetical protein B0H16DRAFT_1740923 [Mycena metata]|uniref:Uncharacterized protein n=1 Tax=Mycena metata TaxID=1033252 RepID=A0AAD7HBL2_9AGAR|nr:hypothetical protein B0H16DRAFT_1740923 [Mycena metata]